MQAVIWFKYPLNSALTLSIFHFCFFIFAFLSIVELIFFLSLTHSLSKKLGVKVDDLPKMWKNLWMKEKHKRAHRNWDMLTLTEVFVSQKRVNVYKHMVKVAPHEYSKLSCGIIFNVFLHTFTLFWLTKTSVSVKLIDKDLSECQNVSTFSVCSVLFLFYSETASLLRSLFLSVNSWWNSLC